MRFETEPRSWKKGVWANHFLLDSCFVHGEQMALQWVIQNDDWKEQWDIKHLRALVKTKHQNHDLEMNLKENIRKDVLASWMFSQNVPDCCWTTLAHYFCSYRLIFVFRRTSLGNWSVPWLETSFTAGDRQTLSSCFFLCVCVRSPFPGPCGTTFSSATWCI